MTQNIDLNEQLTRSFRFQNRELLDNYVILAVTDMSGIITHVSTKLCNVFGYKPAELIDKPYTFLVKTDFINSFENQFKDVKETKTVWHGDIKSASSRDEIIWADTIITPLFNDDGDNVGFIFASNDITKEKKLKKINEENILQKKYDKSILDFMPSLSSAILLKTANGLHQILWIIVLTVVFLLVWGYYSKIDDIVKTQGKIITDQQIQKISSLNGGILNELFAKEGDLVQKNQKILKISDNDFKTEYQKNNILLLSLYAKTSRLEAEATNTNIKQNQDVININKQLMDNEVNLFLTNKKRIQASINILKEKLTQSKTDLTTARKKLDTAKENLLLTEQEFDIKKPLVKQRIISQMELFQLQRDINNLKSEIKSLKISIPSLISSIKEIHKNMDETTETFQSTARDELIKTYNEIQRAKQDLSFYKQKIKDTTILSPSNGIINKITVNTKGEAISPGSIIAEIIPDSDLLLAQVKVSPGDIGFLYIGQHVRLKLRAYDFSLYGAIDGNISYISADTLPDELDPKSEVYLVNIKSNHKYVGDNKNLLVKPGMTVDADILTGKKSILEYVFKPIIKSLGK